MAGQEFICHALHTMHCKTKKSVNLLTNRLYLFGWHFVAFDLFAVCGWALTDSNRRHSACRADALNQLS